jgi:F-type H+-transporting ATPase subunit alpha
VPSFLDDLLSRLRSEQKDLMESINEGGLSDEDEERLSKAIAEMVDDFGPDFDQEGNPLEEGESDRVKDEEERSRPGRTDEEGEGDADDDEGEERKEEEEEEEAVPA